MFKVINNINEFIQNPILEMNEEQINNSKTNIIQLYGNTYKMYDDDWKHHVHIKCTDYCDANCDFCIEKSERNNPQNTDNMIESTINVLSQLAMQGQLRTVSITGGEPTIFPKIKELINLINSFKLTLFSINTNGRMLDNIPENFDGWVDISKHCIDDRKVFKRDFLVTPEILYKFKETHPKAKIRLQCVIGANENIKTIKDVNTFIAYYNGAVDDFSFRNLIINDNNECINELLLRFRESIKNNLVEQVIQDYYVYETYRYFCTNVTLSWSNMNKLKTYNESHDNNFLEEIIIHPDGTVSGSWNKKSLIIHTPDNRNDDKFISCKGINCDNHCLRYIKQSSDRNNNYNIIDSCSINSCRL